MRGPNRLRGTSAAFSLISASLVVAGCAGANESQGATSDQPSETSPADDQRSSSAADSSAEEVAAAEPLDEPEEELPTIRDTDFTGLEWREWVNEVVVTPAEGVEGYDFDVGSAIHYADINSDGHDDALVALEQTEERWFEEIWYIWAWDPDSETAYQAGGPVARGAGCGDHIESVAAGGDHFMIEEYLWPQNSDHDCASTPSIHVTRHVVLEDDWPVMVSPVRADGGICPQTPGTDDLWPTEEFEFRTAPRDSASLVGDPDPASFAEVDVWSRLWLYYPNWMLVHLAYMNPADGPPILEGGYTPCGWVHLEDDTRPIPHDPYIPED